MNRIREEYAAFKKSFFLKRYFSLMDAFAKWNQNKDIPYSMVSFDQWKKFKKSETLFIFGSGPSINDLTPDQWAHIQRHDTLGLNFAFLTKRPMTYFYLGYEPDSKDSIFNNFTSDVRELYKDTLWFYPTFNYYRLLHPLTIPEFFPPNVKIANFRFPTPINLLNDRPFMAEDFKKSLTYRGVMGVGLHLADILNYKKIVLLGVDLHTYRHFFDEIETIKEERVHYNAMFEKVGYFESMIPKENKFRTMDEYYYGVRELYFNPKNIEIYITTEDSILRPRMPLYNWNLN
jgi:hypothetical protein